MLHEIDDPVAIDFVVHQIAELTRRAATAGSFSPFSSQVPQAWRRRQEEGGAPMSKKTRSNLMEIWTATETEKHLRRAAFNLWAATHTPTDISVLNSIDDSLGLADSILHQRLLRSDLSALPDLLRKLTAGENPSFWWTHAKFVLGSEIVVELDAELARCAGLINSTWQSHSDNDHAICDLMSHLPLQVAENLLMKHWENLRYSPNFVQLAIYLATPRLTKLASDAVKACPRPSELLKYLGSNIGLHMEGHPGITREVQIECLSPYLSYMQSFQIRELWDLCNVRGWIAMRQNFLEPYMREHSEVPFESQEKNFAQLDKFVENNEVHRLRFWLESYAKAGASSEYIFHELDTWLKQGRTLGRFKLVREALIQIGHRSDLSILDVVLDNGRVISDDIRRDTIFAVMRRALK